jgi:protein-L-isoaspartate(D-aspartate) O-methyltransferase
MLEMPDEYHRQRATMVEHQLRRRDIHDARVLAAMGSVQRHLFVPEHLRHEAYGDGALPIGEGQTISQPYMVAATCQAAGLRGGERVLEVGAGSGYQAAVLGRLAREVVAIERIPVLADRARLNLAAAGIDNVEVILGDGSKGWPARAPYDCILVAAGAPAIPSALLDQLAEPGRLVIPVGRRDMQRLTIVERLGPDTYREIEGPACVFVPLVGEQGWRDEPG